MINTFSAYFLMNSTVDVFTKNNSIQAIFQSQIVPDTPRMQGDNLGQQLSLYQDLRVRPGLNIDVHLKRNPSNEIDVREHLKSFPPDACKIRHIAEKIGKNS